MVDYGKHKPTIDDMPDDQYRCSCEEQEPYYDDQLYWWDGETYREDAIQDGNHTRGWYCEPCIVRSGAKASRWTLAKQNMAVELAVMYERSPLL